MNARGDTRMNDGINVAATKEFLLTLYKNMKMGADSIVDVSSKVKEGAFRDELYKELDTYEKFAKRIGKLLYDLGEAPKEENIVKKMATKMGMAMNTLTDSTESHIAQMMIEGATMGITENTKLVNEYEEKNISEEALKLGKDSVKFMEDTVEKLKKFL
jgi:hypothetical protein